MPFYGILQAFPPSCGTYPTAQIRNASHGIYRAVLHIHADVFVLRQIHRNLTAFSAFLSFPFAPILLHPVKQVVEVEKLQKESLQNDDTTL